MLIALLDKPIVYFVCLEIIRKRFVLSFSDYVYGETAKNIDQLINKIKLEKKSFLLKEKSLLRSLCLVVMENQQKKFINGFLKTNKVYN